MTKKITAFSVHTTGEGEHVAFTYSIIDNDGHVKAQNKRAEVILLDHDMLSAVNDIYNFLQERIPE